MKKFFSILSASMIVLAGCVFAQKHQKIYPFPSNEVTVVGDTIYSGGKPYAKLLFFQPRTELRFKTPLPPDTVEEARPVSGLGFAIYYYGDDEQVWIHPAKGLSIYKDGKEYTKIEDMQRIWDKFIKDGRALNRESGPLIHIAGRHLEKEDYIRSGVYDVRVSDDGKYISYKTQGILWNSSHKYLVEYGVSK